MTTIEITPASGDWARPHVRVQVTPVTGSKRPATTSTGVLLGTWTGHLDADGEWSIDLPPTDDLAPEGSHYLVTVAGHEMRIVVPASGTFNVADPDIAAPPVAPAVWVPGPVGPMQVILGTVPTAGDLPGDPTHGDAWVVEADGRLRVWSDITSAWSSVPYQGPQGVKGDKGDTGPTGTLGPPGITGGVTYRPSGLDDWWTRLADAASSPGVDVVVIGDSIAAQGTVSVPAWPWHLGRALAGRARLAVSDQVVYPAGGGSVPTVTTPGGTASTVGLGGWSRSLAASESLSHVSTCDAVSVVYSGGGGTLTVRDGGPSGTVLGTIDTGSVSGRSHIWTSDALSFTSRTIWVGASGSTTIVEALYLHRGSRDGGVRVWPAVHHGWRSDDFLPDAGTGRALDLIERLHAAGRLGLVVVATGTNDSTPGGAPYTALLDAIGARTDAPVVAWVPYVNNAFTAGEATAMAATISGRGLPVVRQDVLTPRFQAEHTLDGTHPFPGSQQLLADHVWAVVGGDPIGQALADVPRLGTAATQAAPGDILTRPLTVGAAFGDDFWVPAGSTGSPWTVTTIEGGIHQRVITPTAGRVGVERFSVTDDLYSISTVGMESAQVHATAAWTLTALVQVMSGTPRLVVGASPPYPTVGAPHRGPCVEYTAATDTWEYVHYTEAVGARTTITGPTLTAGQWVRIGLTSWPGVGMVVAIDGVAAVVHGTPRAASGLVAGAVNAVGSGHDGTVQVDLLHIAAQGLTR